MGTQMNIFMLWLILVALTALAGLTANLLWPDKDSETLIVACFLAPVTTLITTLIAPAVIARAFYLRTLHTLGYPQK